jgi:hypothetical protein
MPDGALAMAALNSNRFSGITVDELNAKCLRIANECLIAVRSPGSQIGR